MMRTFAELEALQTCPLCGATTFALAFGGDVMRCGDCQVLFRNPRPTQGAIAESYDTAANYERWQTEEAPRIRMWLRRLELVRRYRPGGALLDVGAGDGRFLDVAREAGFETHATELSSEGAKRTRDRGHQVSVGQFRDVVLREQTFDAITLWHVLEHVPDPGAVLARTRSLLKPGGVLAIAVPNEDHALWRWQLGLARTGSPFADHVWGGEIHLTHFQPNTLQAFLRRVGFRVQEFGIDDVNMRRTLRTRLKLRVQNAVARLTGIQLGVAMYAICRPTIEAPR